MDTEKTVRDGIRLLEQIARNPEDVVEALAPAEGKRTVEKLCVLEEQSAGVQNEAELLALADAVNRLIEETPALAALLLPDEMDVGTAQEVRKITLEDYAADAPESPYVQGYSAQEVRKITLESYGTGAPESRYVQEYVPQIRNHIVECRKELERQLRELFPEDQEQQ
jgi:hypothetical protein